MERRDLRLLLALTALSAVLLLAFSAGLVGGALLYAAPAVLLAVPLLSGRYLGERSLERLAASRRSPAGRTRVAPAALTARGPARAFPRGGLLLARRLAERGPPRALTVS